MICIKNVTVVNEGEEFKAHVIIKGDVIFESPRECVHDGMNELYKSFKKDAVVTLMVALELDD